MLWLASILPQRRVHAFFFSKIVQSRAHKLVVWVLPDTAIVTANQVSVIAFSVLPELIIFSALKITYDHWKMVQSTKRIDAWVWAIAYTIPTLVFLVMTILTITRFVNVEAVSTNAPQATGVMLVVRCLAGWGFGMLQMLWAKLGHEGYSNLFARLRSEIAALVATLKDRAAAIVD
ncbi:hypothetical protein ccbrp13_41960 [Ktedonobacteria bacterium brp13]|nr:hypothetical protein ccbrp13_41960 [Ktedonobacteria bacterium brp13]